MDVIQTSNKQVDKFGTGLHGFSAGNPGAGQPATFLSNTWCDGVQQELINTILAAGLTPSGASLNQLRDAINRRTSSLITSLAAGTHNLTADQAGTFSIDAAAGNVIVNLPASHACTPASVSQEFFFIRRDITQNTVTINCTGGDLLDDAGSSFTLDGPMRYRGVRSSGPLLRWFTCSKSADLTGIQFYTTFSVPPPGAIKENGAELLRSQFPTLFRYASAQGLVSEATWNANSWGRYSVGNGTTTFRIPEDRGEFIRGADDGRGVDPGRAIGTWQAQAIQSHTHPVPVYNTGGVVNIAVGSGAFVGSVPSDSTGGTSTHPRNIARLSCIWI